MDKGAASSRESTPKTPSAAAPAERPYAGDYLEDRSPAGETLRDLAALARDGPRATAQRQALKSVFGPTSGAAVVQAKLEFAGKPKLRAVLAGDTEPLRLEVLAAFEANWELLVGLKTPRLEEMRTEFQRPRAFRNNLAWLESSPVNFGEINLSNPQHVYLYAKEACRFLTSTYADSSRQEERDERRRKLKAGPVPDVPRSPGARDKTFQVALLGTSASVADYVNARAGELDATSTVIIGESQPWRPSDDPRSRGIGFVNHPPSMTSPKRDETQLPKEASGSDEVFEGNAKRLADDIDAVLDRFGARKVNAKITKVSKDDNGWYKVATEAGDYYARKVVSGLGIGPHRMEGQNKLAAQVTSVEHKRREAERVLDLDAFQRLAADPDSPLRQQHRRGMLCIGVSGPNAGTDAVYVATELGMAVAWVVSGDGPAIAEGMGNKIAKPHLVDVYFDYLKGWTISAANYVKLEIGGKWANAADPGKAQTDAENAFFKKQPGWKGRESRDTNKLVDYLVIAQGPDVAKLWDVFDPTATKDLELKGDKSGRFGDVGSNRSRLQGSVDTSLEHASYNIAYEGCWRAVANVIKAEAMGTHLVSPVALQLAEAAKVILGVSEFAPITLQKGVAPRLASTDDSFEIIGGSAIRILNYLDQKANQATAPDALKGGGNEAKMKKVLETLSTPTLLNNDQLTPIRSQIEASADYMPGYIGKEESNFVTDDQTMIAAQIASQYGNIPAELANWVTQKIIEDRHKTGVKPGTSEGSRAFVDKWKATLEKLHVLFGKSSIKAMIESAATKK